MVGHYFQPVRARSDTRIDRLPEEMEEVGLDHNVGAIPHKDPAEDLALLKLIAGREFSFEKRLDDGAEKLKAEEWKHWWEKEGKHQKLDLTALKERFEAYRKAEL